MKQSQAVVAAQRVVGAVRTSNVFLNEDKSYNPVATTELAFTQLYALTRKLYIYAKDLTDKRYSEQVQELQRELFVKKQLILKAINEAKTE